MASVNTDWLEYEHRLRIYRVARKLVTYLAASLAVLFGWLKLKGSELLPAAAALPSGVLIRAALVFWYASWLYGCLLDINQQERVYERAPNEGRLPIAAVAVMLAITIAFALLCSAATLELLLITLAGFWLINALAWIYLTRVLVAKTLEDQTKRSNSVSLPERERPHVIRAYLYGHWQAWRFGIGLVLLTALYAELHTNVIVRLPGGASLPLQRTFPLGIAAFIVLAEVWVWLMRLKMSFCLNFLKDLRQYQLAEPAPPN